MSINQFGENIFRAIRILHAVGEEAADQQNDRGRGRPSHGSLNMQFGRGHFVRGRGGTQLGRGNGQRGCVNGQLWRGRGGAQLGRGGGQLWRGRGEGLHSFWTQIQRGRGNSGISNGRGNGQGNRGKGQGHSRSQRSTNEKLIKIKNEVVKEFDKDLSNNKIVVVGYTCHDYLGVKEALEKFNGTFLFIDIENVDNGEDLKKVLEERTGVNSAVWVFMNAQYFGGYYRIKELRDNGKLSEKMNVSGY